MDDGVLLLSNRGHTVRDTETAVGLLRQNNYQIGLQLMLGLPGDNEERAIKSAEKAAAPAVVYICQSPPGVPPSSTPITLTTAYPVVSPVLTSTNALPDAARIAVFRGNDPGGHRIRENPLGKDPGQCRIQPFDLGNPAAQNDDVRINHVDDGGQRLSESTFMPFKCFNR